MKRARRTKLLPTGKGAPVLRASAVTLPKEPSPEFQCEGQQVSLSLGEKDRAAATGIVAEVRRALALGDDRKRIIRLGFLVENYSDVTLRVPEFHEFMDRLIATRQDQAVARILGSSLGRGRPRVARGNYFFLVGLIEMLKAREVDSAARAAEIVKRRYAPHHEYIASLSVKRIQEIYSEYKHLFDLFQSGRYMPPDHLADEPWQPPRK